MGANRALGVRAARSTHSARPKGSRLQYGTIFLAAASWVLSGRAAVLRRGRRGGQVHVKSALTDRSTQDDGLLVLWGLLGWAGRQSGGANMRQASRFLHTLTFLKHGQLGPFLARPAAAPRAKKNTTRHGARPS